MTHIPSSNGAASPDAAPSAAETTPDPYSNRIADAYRPIYRVMARLVDGAPRNGYGGDWPGDQARRTIEDILDAGLRFCTVDERQLLDDITNNPAPDLDVQMLLMQGDARDAVIDTAITETVAEQTAKTATIAALDAPTRSQAVETAKQAAIALPAARQARRHAVETLQILTRRQNSPHTPTPP